MPGKIRQPIIAVLGHVDHGKTTLLDKIRSSSVAAGESGGITQAIGSSEVPIDIIKTRYKGLLEKIKINLTIPGLLFLDTPGHAAFVTLRKRGGAIADIAVLVIDINEGVQEQTDESIKFLKELKTPFVVAATKIDRILSWMPHPDESFLKTIGEQPKRAAEETENKIYNLIGQLGERGFDSERYDRVSDFTKQISIVPVSGKTGEGVPDLLVVLSGLAQKYLQKRIELEGVYGKGTILEVKEQKGLGPVIDVILYDGEAAKGDYLVIGGKKIIITKIKALLKPEQLKDIRAERKFLYLDSVSAASGVRISAPELEGVIAGSPIRVVRKDADMEKAKKEVEQEIEDVEIQTEKEGVMLKADTLGSLEAMVKLFQEAGIPIRKAEVGAVTKQDVLEIKTLKEPLIFSFNSPIQEEAKKSAEGSKIKIFSSDVIYRLIEQYQKWKKGEKERREEEMLNNVTRPARLRVLPGCVFRQSKPAVFGVEINAGVLKPHYKLSKKGKTIGEIKEVQKSGSPVDEAVSGDRVALSMDDVVVGKDILEGDVLETSLRAEDIKILEKVRHKLRDDEKQILEGISGNR